MKRKGKAEMSKHQSKSGSRKKKGRTVKRISPSGITVTDHGDGRKTIEMNAEMKTLIETQLQAFRDKFGREPGPHDPIFFDPDSDVPREIPMRKFEEMRTTMISHGLREGSLPPEIAFAYWATERLLTADSIHLVSPAERREWEDAVQEYLDGETEQSRVFRVVMVEASKMNFTGPENIERLLEIADELGVRDAVVKRFNQAVSN